MLSLIPPAQVRFDPFAQADSISVPQKHRSLVALPLREGEIVILKDGKEAKDWYCAQIVKVLPTHVLVHYCITNTSPLDGYSNTTPTERENNISQASFLKTWCLNGGRGPVTTTSPEGIRETRDIWSGGIKIGDLQEHLLIRNVELSASGNLSQITAETASKLKYPHHVGA